MNLLRTSLLNGVADVTKLGTSLVLNMATIGILMNIAASGKTARGLA